jgi:hypothetical protein
MGLVNELNDVTFWDAQTGWAVGERGTVLHTADGGRTWQHLPRPTESDLQRVAFVNARVGWVLAAQWWFSHASDSGLYYTADGGRSWEARALPPIVPASGGGDFVWEDARVGWMVSEGGDVFRTTDGGRSWAAGEGDPPEDLAPRPWSDDTRTIYNHVWETPDGGETWALRRETIQRRAVTFVDERRGWAVGSFGPRGERITLLHTRDGGRSWSADDRRVEPLPLAATATQYLNIYLTQRNAPTEALVTRLLRAPCVPRNEALMEDALTTLGWTGAEWPRPRTPAIRADALGWTRTEADLDADGEDEIVLHGEVNMFEKTVSIMDWDGDQWQVAWKTPFGSLLVQRMEIDVEPFVVEGQPDGRIQSIVCGHTGCIREILLVHCTPGRCGAVWSTHDVVVGDVHDRQLTHNWSGSDYRFVDRDRDGVREIEQRTYGMRYKVQVNEQHVPRPETIRAEALTTTATTFRWDGGRYTPTQETVLAPGGPVDTRAVTETLDLDGDGALERAASRWHIDEHARWLQQSLTLEAQEGPGNWVPLQTLTATVLSPELGVSLRDTDADGRVELVHCNPRHPPAPTLEHWPNVYDVVCRIHEWHPRRRRFGP